MAGTALDAEYDRAVVLSVAFLSGAVLLGLALAVWVSRGISRPLRGVADVSHAAEESNAGATQAAGAAQQLADLARDLDRSIAHFRV